MTAIVPIPRCDVSVRDATPDDVPFIDSLQKQHARQVGFLRESWIEGKIKKGQVLIAEDGAGAVGYVISQDKYLSREELGLVVQLCVAPGARRKFVGATLLKAAFDRAAYGCTLFCCWCAQDIEANRFWESMGFVPLAYRGGSVKKGRVHIFWQKRIREGDTGAGATRWWYPTETHGGAIGEGRIVLPIPMGKHWSDEMPVILPATENAPKLEGPRPGRSRAGMLAAAAACEELPPTRKPKAKVQFGVPTEGPEVVAAAPVVEEPKQGRREKKSKAKNDPKLVAAARELRDRWLEHVNGAGWASGAGEMLLEGAGKYDVSRGALPEAPKCLKALPQAA